ncbi:SRPBCC family protein [Nocardioides sp. NBC_00850]|uniref:SRPBCC family protein n=1 Tax=Nocardioides sp. NBC_00850 TaxID=2976001 RepID=UPI00386C0981|nr:SRPBCC family protein [Nocardioides sp. NBC_00850]
MTEQIRKKAAADTEDSGLLSQLPIDRLRKEALGISRAFGKRSLSKLGSGVEGLTDRLTGFADGVPSKASKGGSTVKAGAKAAVDKVTAPVGKVKNTAAQVKDTATQVKDTVDKVSGSLNKSEQSSGKKLKVTNIVETVDVPVSRDVAYEQWTQFEDFPSFTKKVENVTQEEDEVVTWQAQVFWSHRTWKATILDQVPNEHIVWKSESEKGRVDGAVTFHELAPNLTRILVSLEYYPKGLFEHTGNLWRAQGRRVRLEMKHFRRHVANHTLLHRDEIEGWTGEIHDKEVVDDGSGEGTENGQKNSSEKSREQSGKTKARTASSSRRSEKSSGSTPGNGSSNNRSSGNGSSGDKPQAKKTTAKKTAAKKPAAKKTAAKKTAANKPAAKKTTSTRRPTKQSASKQSASKRSPRKQSASKQSTSRRTSSGSSTKAS